jgi:integrase
MAARRSRGDGGLHWDDARSRWIPTASLGFGPDGRRVVKRASGRTETEAKERLKQVLRDYDDGLAIAPADYTVERAVNDWLTYGLSGRDEMTVKTCQYICRIHVLPALGSRKLRDLTADDVDRWLAQKSLTLSTRTLQAMHVLSLLTGARTEELRALTWEHVQLDAQQAGEQVIRPHVAVWRSVRKGGDTKTQKSRRTVALPERCVEALRRQLAQQEAERAAAGDQWREHGLVFTSKVGTPRELRHSFVSLLSDHGLPLEEISRLVGHSSTSVTEAVYRKQIRPVLQSGAVAMDRIFSTLSHSVSHSAGGAEEVRVLEGP